jgi:HEAT repeat protein
MVASEIKSTPRIPPLQPFIGPMAKRDVEQEITNLSRLRDSPATDQTVKILRRALGDRVNLVAARAAQVAGDLRLKQLIPDLITAFDRRFDRPTDTDPQCWAKNAIAKTLTDLDHDESPPFLRGYRYVQMESTWGGKTDTAVTLRSLCTLALVQCADLSRAEKLRHLVNSMLDHEETVRIDALRALEQMEGEEAVLLLRFKAGIGDERAAVVGQALDSLIKVEGPPALEYARGFLQERATSPPSIRSTAEEQVEEAALALGASRLPEAVEILKNAWDSSHLPIFLQAISSSRQEPGFQFLLSLVREGRERDAFAALDALSLHRDSPEVRAAAHAAASARDAPILQDRFRDKFGDAPRD